ncbi:probable chitinase 10 [Daphnia pulicaria]|uniref:probable chitinase 10 n=1 Tax=Daphnia pulicaria TaxID=35523 RepID=UPI001EECC009|nr:probable chitinase 10 [Daphnia pulicaria]
MTANSLRVLALLASLVVALPVVENLAVKRQVVQPAAERSGSFYRGAVESPPQIIQAGPGFQRSSVEYRPNPDFRPRNPLALKNFNIGVFLSQFYFPSLQVDHYRQQFPAYAPFVLPTYVDNLLIQKDITVKESCTNGQGLRPNPSDCSGYQMCNHGQWVSMSCADGLYWNAELAICDWPANVRCALPESSQPAPQPSSTTAAPEPSVVTSAAPASPEPSVTSAAPASPEPSVTSAAPAVPSTTLAPETAATPSPPSSSGPAKVICYYTNWSWYRQGEAKYAPADIDLKLCTHILYGFATLDPNKGIMQVFDSWSDTDEYGPSLYAKVVALKKHGIKVLIALGGWNDSAGGKYSVMVNNPASRRRFIENAMIFIENYGFDGLDLDWEYPKCWQVDCNAGPASDKPAFAAFVKELREAFNPKGWLLTAAVSPSKAVIDAGYDIPSLSRDLDWIGVMTYDYHGHWDKKTGHVAPLGFHSEADVAYFNTEYTLNYWIRGGADPGKVIMGIPLYGQSFTLENPSNNGLNAPAKGTGSAGEFTRQAGFLAYYEICKTIANGGWNVVQDEEGKLGPYAYRGDQWVSFDDVNMVRKKSEIAKAMKIGGAMIWALDLDDFRNKCGCETYPLLKTINRVLRNYPASSAKCDIKSVPGVFQTTALTKSVCQENSYKPHESDCTSYYHCVFGQWSAHTCPNGLFWNKEYCDWPYNTQCGDGSQTYVPPVPSPTAAPSAPVAPSETSTSSGAYVEWKPSTTTAKPTPSPFPEVTLPDTGFKVICYFTNWAGYRTGEGKYKPEDIDPAMCTHIIYGFATLSPSELTMRVFDSWADTDEYGPNLYAKVTALKKNGIKVLIALGGWNDSLGSKYSQLVNNPTARKRFVDNAVAFVEKYGFDGLDLDWEYPKCWQVDCKAGPDSDKPAFTAWVRELSEAFKPRGWLLSSAVSPSKTVIDLGYEVAALSPYFDWIGVMTYDYFGNWDKTTGHVAPLYAHSEVENKYFNTNFTLNYWIELGADPSKIILGMPMYGQSFTLEDPTSNGLNAKSKGPGEAGEFTRQGGFLAFYEICHRMKQGGWTVVQDPEGAMGPYAYKGNQWTSFDDVAVIRRKSELVKSMNIGGAMIWALDLDDFSNRCGCERYPLLRTINRVLRNYPTPDPNCNYA